MYSLTYVPHNLILIDTNICSYLLNVGLEYVSFEENNPWKKRMRSKGKFDREDIMTYNYHEVSLMTINLLLTIMNNVRK